LKRSPLTSALLLCIGCPFEKETVSPLQPSPPLQDCSIRLEEVTPANGAVGVDTEQWLSFTLSGEDPAPYVALVDASGNGVAGRTYQVGAFLDFYPDRPLNLYTSYSATLHYCRDTLHPAAVTTTFSTTAGEPTGDRTGDTYKVDLAEYDREWSLFLTVLIEPLYDADLLFTVTRQTNTTLSLTGARTAGDDGPQDTCLPTFELQDADFSANPLFVSQPFEVVWLVAGVQAPISNMQLSGSFAPDGSTFYRGELSGEFDLRTILPSLIEAWGITDLSQTCGLVTGFGETCVPCEADEVIACLDLRLTDITANRLSESSVACVGETDCHPDCATSTCADPLAGVCD